MSATKCLPAVYESPVLKWEQKQRCTTELCNFKWDISVAVNSIRVRGVIIIIPLKCKSSLWKSDKGEMSVVGAEKKT